MISQHILCTRWYMLRMRNLRIDAVAVSYTSYIQYLQMAEQWLERFPMQNRSVSGTTVFGGNARALTKKRKKGKIPFDLFSPVPAYRKLPFANFVSKFPHSVSKQ